MKLLNRIAHFALFLLVAGQLSVVFAQIPHFLTPITYPSPGASMVALADVNGEGVLDAVIANGFVFTGSGVSVLLGRPNGTFLPAKKIVPAGNPSFIVVGDFNNDGKADIAVANESNPANPAPAPGGPPENSVSILLGNGDGTFQPAINTTTLGALSMAAADFGDGKLDLAVGTGSLSPVEILLGSGDGTFTVSDTSLNGLSTLVFTGDFNHDGKQDFLAGGVQMLGNGDGTFTLGQALPVQGLSAVPDSNGDGIPDLAGQFISFHAITGLIAFGLPDGTWAPSLISNFNGLGNVVAAKFDSDTKNDIFGAGSPTLGGINQPVGGLFLSNGDGFFTKVEAGFGITSIGASGSPAFTAAADLDHNGAPDVVIANGKGIVVALNTFGHPPLLAQLTTGVSFLVGGASTTGTVSVGGPAPAGGALVTLTSSNPAATLPGGTSVLIPAGSQSATFPITTQSVAAPATATITGTYHAIKQKAVLNVEPPESLSSISVAPASLIGMFGGDKAVGTITLSVPASNGVVVNLSSAQPGKLSVPATVAVAPGATTATFALSALPVPSDTVVAVTAALLGATTSAQVTVRKEAATVVITKAEYTVSKSLLHVKASSTDRVSALQLYNPSTGASIGSIPLVNVGKFVGQATVVGPLTSVAVQSSVGGVAIAPAVQK